MPVGSECTNPFKGSLDGQNFSISNLNIDLTGSRTVPYYGIGFFPYMKGATVKNLFFLNSVVKSSGKKCFGGINNCYVGILAGKRNELIF